MHVDHRHVTDEVFITLELAVESGIWYVFPSLEQRHHRSEDPKSSLQFCEKLGPLVPHFWEGRDDETQEEEAATSICRNYENWLYTHIHCQHSI